MPVQSQTTRQVCIPSMLAKTQQANRTFKTPVSRRVLMLVWVHREHWGGLQTRAIITVQMAVKALCSTSTCTHPPPFFFSLSLHTLLCCHHSVVVNRHCFFFLVLVLVLPSLFIFNADVKTRHSDGDAIVTTQCSIVPTVRNTN